MRPANDQAGRRKWFEIRVELGKDRHGKSYYAALGKRTTYRLPTRQELIDQHGSDKVPEIQGLCTRQVPENQGAKVPEIQERRSLKFRDPSPHRTSQKNHSSLSPREDDAEAPTTPGSEPEREIDEASQEDQTTNPVHRLLLDAGCPTENLTEAERWIADECQPRGLGWWRKTAGNDDLKVHVAAFLEAGHARSVCAVCDDTGQTGDWMNSRACDCIWLKDPAAARRQFMAQLKDFPDCDHGLAGGDVKAPNGWQHCSSCRGPGWVDPNVQPRTNDKRINTRRSTGVVRAEQALRVAADLDALSPADRRIRDAGPLYEKYKALENQKDRFTPIPVPIGQSGYDESVR
jgi:hypothetical protein